MCRSKKYGVPFILNDRLGDAKSTRLKGKPPTFCIIDLFFDKLVNLPNHFSIQDGFDLTGHSWGGILASGFECPLNLFYSLQVCHSSWIYAHRIFGVLSEPLSQILRIRNSMHLTSFIASRYVVELFPPPVSEFSQALSANRPLPVSRALVQRWLLVNHLFLTTRTSALLNWHLKRLIQMLGRLEWRRGSSRVVARVREYAIGRNTVIYD